VTESENLHTPETRIGGGKTLMTQKAIGTTRREFLGQAAAISVATAMMGAGSAVDAERLPETLDAESRRRADLETFLKIFPPSSPPRNGRIKAFDNTWEEWVKRSGELPPDFAYMPSIPHLPDPLLFTENGRRIAVTDAAQWNHRKQWIRTQMEQWVHGKMPPPPGNMCSGYRHAAGGDNHRARRSARVRSRSSRYLASAIDRARRQRALPRILD
jgi:hypothetical protein